MPDKTQSRDLTWPAVIIACIAASPAMIAFFYIATR